MPRPCAKHPTDFDCHQTLHSPQDNVVCLKSNEGMETDMLTYQIVSFGTHFVGVRINGIVAMVVNVREMFLKHVSLNLVS